MRLLLIFVAAGMLAWAPAAAQPTALRAAPRAEGPALRLGDVFLVEGEAAAKEIAPAPPAGERGRFSTLFLEAAARSAGLEWVPPAGLLEVEVEGPEFDQRGSAAAQRRALGGGLRRPARAEAVIRRGDAVTLLFEAGGLRLSARARAMANAGEGETVRLVNVDSQREIEAVAVGPGLARVARP